MASRVRVLVSCVALVGLTSRCTPLASSLLGSPAREQRLPRDGVRADQLGGWR